MGAPFPAGAVQLSISQHLLSSLQESTSQPPIPTSSISASQLISPGSASTWRPLSSPSAFKRLWVRWALWSPTASYLRVRWSHLPGSSLRDPDSTSALWPIGYTLAPAFLIFTMARHPTSSTRLPRPSSSVVNHPLPRDSKYSGCASSFRPYGSVRLLFHVHPRSLWLRRGLPDHHVCSNKL